MQFGVVLGIPVETFSLLVPWIVLAKYGISTGMK
jgi:hypothetical protein